MKIIKNIKKLRLLLVLLLAAALLLGQTALAADTAASADTATSADTDTQYLKSVMDMIKDQYGGQPTDNQLVQGALSGMFNSLDPYTTFYTPEQANSFIKNVGGTYVGIGVSLEVSGSYVMIAEVFSSSPAEKAGLVQGDKIAEVDGRSVANKSPGDVTAIISGTAGTKVRLGIFRRGVADLMTFEVTRNAIKINPVTYEIRDGIGYIKIDTFNENTSEFFTKALEYMDSNKIKNLVLDLRSNPGGEVGQAATVASMFVHKGLITRLDYKSNLYPDVEYKSSLVSQKYRLAVLVNEMSASASEIVAGAIQDTEAGLLIGTKTFGKAKFQGMIPVLTPAAYEKYGKQLGVNVVNVYELEDKYNITPAENEILGYTKMTLGYYYTPKGRMIDGVGLTPDVQVPDPKAVKGVDVTGVQRLAGTTSLGLNSQGKDVVNAEKMLKVMGYNIDTPDSTLDAKTVSAVKKFQTDTKAVSTGVLDPKTQKTLNTEFEKLLPKLDAQYAKALELLRSR